MFTQNLAYKEDIFYIDGGNKKGEIQPVHSQEILVRYGGQITIKLFYNCTINLVNTVDSLQYYAWLAEKQIIAELVLASAEQGYPAISYTTLAFTKNC